MKCFNCKKCGGKVFLLDIANSCDNCEHNGAWDTEGEGYTYDQVIIDSLGLTRDHVDKGGECLFGVASGNGCYMVTCKSCGKKFNIPTFEG